MASALPVGSDYPLFTVRVAREVSDSPTLPNQLSTINWYKISDTANPGNPVPIGISEGPMAMLLNGRPYAYNDVQPGERIALNSVQLMEIFHAHGGGGGHGQAAKTNTEQDHSQSSGNDGDRMQGMGKHGRGRGGMGMGMHDNDQGGGKMGMGMHGNDQGGGMMGMGGGMGMHGNDQGGGMMGMDGGMGGGMGGGMMMSMAHPIHLHGQQFQIVSRNIGAEEKDSYETVREGFIEGGLKDTVLVMPGESVRIIKPFQDFKGLFMYHCHNLEHEDMGMMRDFLVE